jgi:hypothetical protein
MPKNKSRQKKRSSKMRSNSRRTPKHLVQRRLFLRGLGYKFFMPFEFTSVRPQVQSAAIGTVAGQIVFSLADALNVSAIQALADSFEIDQVRIEFKPTSQPVSNTNSGSTVQFIAPLFAACVDTNSIGLTPSSLAQVQEYRNSKTVTADKKLSFSFRPAALLDGYATSLTTFYAPCPTPLATTGAGATAYHYGVPWFMQAVTGAGPPAGVFTYDVTVHYKLSLYNQK